MSWYPVLPNLTEPKNLYAHGKSTKGHVRKKASLEGELDHQRVVSGIKKPYKRK